VGAVRRRGRNEFKSKERLAKIARNFLADFRLILIIYWLFGQI